MKILLVQTSFLGDLVLSTPVIAGIKILYPGSELWLLTTPSGAELLAEDPRLSGIIAFDKKGSDGTLGGMWALSRRLRKLSFDAAFSIHRSARTALLLALSGLPKRTGFSDGVLPFLYQRQIKRSLEQHAVLRNLAILSAEPGFANLPNALSLTLPSGRSDSQDVRDIMESGRPYIALVPGSAWATKAWFAAGFRFLAKSFGALQYSVVVLGDKSQRDLGAAICSGTEAQNLAGVTSIADLISLIAKASLVVCNDSMALHVASSFKVPTVAIFCATSPAFGFGPWKNENAIVIEEEGLECKPCSRHGGKLCPTGSAACMHLSPEKVLMAANDLLGVKLGVAR